MPLDHSVLRTLDHSVTWVTMGIRVITCGLRADQATSHVLVGLSDWPPKWWRISVSVMAGVLVVVSGS